MQMCRFAYQQISDRIKKLNRNLAECRAQHKELQDALEAAVAQYAGYPPEVLAETAPDWLEKARKALKLTSSDD